MFKGKAVAESDLNIFFEMKKIFPLPLFSLHLFLIKYIGRIKEINKIAIIGFLLIVDLNIKKSNINIINIPVVE